jgi:hypothetical protein
MKLKIAGVLKDKSDAKDEKARENEMKKFLE